MKVLRALGAGLGQVLGSPMPVLVIWLAVMLVALPAAVVMQKTIRADIGRSTMSRELLGGLDLGWLEEFHARQSGLSSSLTPSTVSSVAPFDNLERWFSGEWLTEHRGLAAIAISFILLWILLQGGVLDHLTRPETRFELASFGAAAFAYFFRFSRLAVLTAFGYYGVYRFARWLFPEVERRTLEVTAESTVLGWHLAAALIVVTLMSLVHLAADYAKIATVVEGRRSMVLSILRSLGRVLLHPLQAFGLYGMVVALLLLVQGSYFLVAADIGAHSAGAIVAAFGMGQIYLLLRWYLRVARLGAQMRLFQQWTGRARLGVERYR